MSFTPEGAVKPSSIESDIYESQMSAIRVMEMPNNQQMRVEYDADSNPIYVGVTGSGTDSSTSGWVISKYTWSSGNCTLKQIAEGSWDGRASLTYS